MSMNRFLNEPSTMLVVRSEMRFGREVRRLLGPKNLESKHGTKPKSETVKHDCSNEPKKEG